MTPTGPTEAVSLYTGDEYARQHPTWHLEDAPHKAANLMPGVRAILAKRPADVVRVADVGAGVGGVGVHLKRLAEAEFPGTRIDLTAFEISPEATRRARKLFPDLRIEQKFLTESDGPFDAVILADVLEHLENPWELLRTTRAASAHLLLNQPLLENFSTFRHADYRGQRETWGHIAFFNYRSFLDMALASGWRPLKADLVAPWEMAGATGGTGLVKRMLVRRARLMSSFFMSGFYLIGAFEHC
jgi:SAM-dependent methyltransferase